MPIANAVGLGIGSESVTPLLWPGAANADLHELGLALSFAIGKYDIVHMPPLSGGTMYITPGVGPMMLMYESTAVKTLYGSNEALTPTILDIVQFSVLTF